MLESKLIKAKYLLIPKIKLARPIMMIVPIVKLIMIRRPKTMLLCTMKIMMRSMRSPPPRMTRSQSSARIARTSTRISQGQDQGAREVPGADLAVASSTEKAPHRHRGRDAAEKQVALPAAAQALRILDQQRDFEEWRIR